MMTTKKKTDDYVTRVNRQTSEVSQAYGLIHDIRAKQGLLDQSSVRRRQAEQNAGTALDAAPSPSQLTVARSTSTVVQSAEQKTCVELVKEGKSLAEASMRELARSRKLHQDVYNNGSRDVVCRMRVGAIDLLNRTTAFQQPDEPALTGFSHTGPAVPQFLTATDGTDLRNKRMVMSDDVNSQWPLQAVWNACQKWHEAHTRLAENALGHAGAISKSRESVEQSSKVAQEARQQRDDLQSQLNDKTNELRQVKESLEDARAELSSSISSQQHRTELDQQAAEAKKAYSELETSSRQELETKIAEVNQTNEESNTALREELERVRGVIDSQRGQIDSLTQEKAGLVSDNERLKLAKQTADALNSAGDNAKNVRIQDLESHATTQRELSHVYKRNAADFERRLVRSDEELQRARADAGVASDEAQKACRDLQRERDEARNASDTGRGELDAVTHARDEALRAHDALTEDVNEKVKLLHNSRDEQRRTQAALDDAQKETDELRAEKGELDQLLPSKEFRIQELSGEVDACKRRLAEALHNVLHELGIADDGDTDAALPAVQAHAAHDRALAAEVTRLREGDGVRRAAIEEDFDLTANPADPVVRHIVHLRCDVNRLQRELSHGPRDRRYEQRVTLQWLCSVPPNSDGVATPLTDQLLNELFGQLAVLQSTLGENEPLHLDLPRAALAWDVGLVDGAHLVAAGATYSSDNVFLTLWLLASVPWLNSFSLLVAVELILAEHARGRDASDRDRCLLWDATVQFAQWFTTNVPPESTKGWRTVAYVVLRCFELCMRLRCAVTAGDLLARARPVREYVARIPHITDRALLLHALSHWLHAALESPETAVSLLECLSQQARAVSLSTPDPHAPWVIDAGSAALVVEPERGMIFEHSWAYGQCSVANGQLAIVFDRTRRSADHLAVEHAPLVFTNDAGAKKWRVAHFPVEPESLSYEEL